MHQAEIDELIRKSRVGDKGSFGQLVKFYANYVFTVVFRMVNDEMQAEDIAQDTFVKAWVDMARFDSSKSKFSTWLYTIATRKCIDYLRQYPGRRSWWSLEPIPDVPDEHGRSDLENKEIGQMIQRACESLSPQQKVVFVLRDLEDLAVEEVMSITGFSEKKIRDNLYVARQKVRELLKRYLKCEL